jgi:hypothetical protein
MRKTRLSFAAAIVILGSIHLAGAPPLSAGSYECYACVNPPIECVDPSEFDNDCDAQCSSAQKYALDCPYYDQTCGEYLWRVDCGSIRP